MTNMSIDATCFFAPLTSWSLPPRTKILVDLLWTMCFPPVVRHIGPLAWVCMCARTRACVCGQELLYSYLKEYWLKHDPCREGINLPGAGLEPAVSEGLNTQP